MARSIAGIRNEMAASAVSAAALPLGMHRPQRMQAHAFAQLLPMEFGGVGLRRRERVRLVLEATDCDACNALCYPAPRLFPAEIFACVVSSFSSRSALRFLPVPR